MTMPGTDVDTMTPYGVSLRELQVEQDRVFWESVYIAATRSGSSPIHAEYCANQGLTARRKVFSAEVKQPTAPPPEPPPEPKEDSPYLGTGG